MTVAGDAPVWRLAYTPWISIALWFMIGALAIFPSVYPTGMPKSMALGFAALGLGDLVLMLFLPKVIVLADKREHRIVVRSGAWTGLTQRVRSIPIQAASAVILRWNVSPNRTGRVWQGTSLVIRSASGAEFALYPNNTRPGDPAELGRSLARYLGIDYRQEGNGWKTTGNPK